MNRMDPPTAAARCMGRAHSSSRQEARRLLCRGNFTYQEHNSGQRGTEGFIECPSEKRHELVPSAAEDLGRRARGIDQIPAAEEAGVDVEAIGSKANNSTNTCTSSVLKTRDAPMKNRSWSVAVVVVAGCLCCGDPRDAASTTNPVDLRRVTQPLSAVYVPVIDVGTLDQSVAWDINNQGVVVGNEMEIRTSQSFQFPRSQRFLG